jgi:hypothetical protein
MSALRTLQPTVDGTVHSGIRGGNVGKNCENTDKSTRKCGTTTRGRNKAIKRAPTIVDSGDNTDVTLLDEAPPLTKADLLAETPTANYWRRLAERLASQLDAARQDNFALCRELGACKELCAKLQPIADEYEALKREALAGDSGIFDDSATITTSDPTTKDD